MLSKIIVIKFKNMSIQTILNEIGLNKSKGDVYLAALETGRGSVIEIAKKANLPRTTVHEILQTLNKMGLVSYIAKGRGKIYIAEKPNKLLNILKAKQIKLEKALPELTSLLNTKGLLPKARLYEGIEGIKTIFEDTLTTSDKLLRGILSMEDLYQIPGKDFMNDYVDKRIKAGIKLKVIRSKQKEVEETWNASTKENRELHYASDDFVFPMTTYIYDDKVALIGTEKENFGMIIESEEFYKTLLNLFEITWQVTKVAKKID